MRIRWGMVLGIIAVFAMGALAGMAIGNFKNGLYYSSLTEMEKLNFSEWKESSGFSHLRGVAFVPPEYGKLIAVTGGPGDTMFWYEDQAGVVRNIPVDSRSLLTIRREGRRSS